jgi:hypothetical protein
VPGFCPVTLVDIFDGSEGCVEIISITPPPAGAVAGAAIEAVPLDGPAKYLAAKITTPPPG